MHRQSRGGRDAVSDFGDPFAGFGGFTDQRSFMSDFLGGRDPFEAPFFRNPLGSALESSFHGSPGIPFANMHASGFVEHQGSVPKRSRGGLIIEEINSDDDKEDEKKGSEKPKNSTRKPVVEDSDDEGMEKVNKQFQLRGHHSGPNHRNVQPQTKGFTIQSSSVTYASSNGTYYTSSRMRRTGSDGAIFEERKEADTATRQATHRISRGFHNKGHSITRKLNSDGMVDTKQTLHNLSRDELDSFEKAWARNSRSFPSWTGSSNDFDDIAGNIGQNGQTSRGGRMMSVEGSSNPSSSGAQQVGRSRRDSRYRNA